jgi:hypothetical protein
VCVCVGGGRGGHLCTVELAMRYSFQLARNDRVNLRFSLCTILYMQKKVQRDSATRFATGIVDTGGKFAKVAAQLFFKSANSWSQSAVANP